MGKTSDSNLLALLSSGLLNEVIETKSSRSLSLNCLLKNTKIQNVSAWLQVKYRAQRCVLEGFRFNNIKFGWMGTRFSWVVATGNLDVFQMLYEIFS